MKRIFGRDKRVHSYYSRLLAVCFVVMLVIFSLQAVLFFNYSSEQFTGYISETSQKVVILVQNELDTWLLNLDRRLDNIYQNPTFLQSLEQPGNTISAQPALDLLALSEYFQPMTGIYIYDSSSCLRSLLRRGRTSMQPNPWNEDNENAAKLRTFINEQTDELCAMTGRDSDGAPFIRVIKRLYQDMGRRTCGFIVCDFRLAPLEKIALSAPISPEQFLWIKDTSGAMEFITPSLEKPDIGNAKEQWQMLESSPSQKTGLRIGLYTQDSLIYDGVKKIISESVRIVCILAAIFIAFAVISSLRTNRRMGSILKAVDAISSGECDRRFDASGNDEIGVLCREFNKTLDSLQMYDHEKEKVHKLLEETRYRALQSQVNPHFLYNTLDNIGAIAEMQNCGIVGEMCTALSKMFRYSIQADTENSGVTLEEELRQVDNYMLIMNVRMNGKLLLTKNAEENVLTTLLPRLSIQPLVENAVNHGLRSKRGDKRLKIDAFLQGDDVIISVADNGDEPDIDSMRRILAGEMTKSDEHHASIGLRNINERIKILFGDKYGITVERENGFTIVKIVVPEVKNS